MPNPTSRESHGGDAERWAKLADLTLIVSREIAIRGYSDHRAVVLSQSESMVMRFLQHQPDANPGRIAAATGLRRSNLSTVLKGLERKGLIERFHHPDDARAVTVHATERGVNNFQMVRNERAGAVCRAVARDTSNLDAAIELLAKIQRGMTGERRQ